MKPQCVVHAYENSIVWGIPKVAAEPRLHRINGPAMISVLGYGMYYLANCQVSFEDYCKRVNADATR